MFEMICNGFVGVAIAFCFLKSQVGLGVVSHALNPELVSDSEDIYAVKIDKCDEYYIGAFKFYQIHRIYRRGGDNA